MARQRRMKARVARAKKAMPPPMTGPARKDTIQLTRAANIGLLTKQAADQGWGWTFSLQDTDGYTELTSLFDQYVIRQVTLEITWNGLSVGPMLTWAVEKDSATAPSASTMAQRSHRKVFAFSPDKRRLLIRLKPTIAVGTTEPSGTTWIDCADPSRTHYGLVAFIDWYNSTSYATSELRIAESYDLSFRGVR